MSVTVFMCYKLLTADAKELLQYIFDYIRDYAQRNKLVKCMNTSAKQTIDAHSNTYEKQLQIVSIE